MNWNLSNRKDTKLITLYGDDRIDSSLDFNSKKEIDSFVQKVTDSLKCRNCDSQRLRTGTLYVKIQKVEFYQEVSRKNIFGKTLYKQELDKTKYRIVDSHFLHKNRSLKCKNCKSTQFLDSLGTVTGGRLSKLCSGSTIFRFLHSELVYFIPREKSFNDAVRQLDKVIGQTFSGYIPKHRDILRNFMNNMDEYIPETIAGWTGGLAYHNKLAQTVKDQVRSKFLFSIMDEEDIRKKL